MLRRARPGCGRRPHPTLAENSSRGTRSIRVPERSATPFHGETSHGRNESPAARETSPRWATPSRGTASHHRTEPPATRESSPRWATPSRGTTTHHRNEPPAARETSPRRATPSRGTASHHRNESPATRESSPRWATPSRGTTSRHRNESTADRESSLRRETPSRGTTPQHRNETLRPANHRHAGRHLPEGRPHTTETNRLRPANHRRDGRHHPEGRPHTTETNRLRPANHRHGGRGQPLESETRAASSRILKWNNPKRVADQGDPNRHGSLNCLIPWEFSVYFRAWSRSILDGNRRSASRPQCPVQPLNSKNQHRFAVTPNSVDLHTTNHPPAPLRGQFAPWTRGTFDDSHFGIYRFAGRSMAPRDIWSARLQRPRG